MRSSKLDFGEFTDRMIRVRIARELNARQLSCKSETFRAWSKSKTNLIYGIKIDIFHGYLIKMGYQLTHHNNHYTFISIVDPKLNFSITTSIVRANASLSVFITLRSSSFNFVNQRSKVSARSGK